MNGQNVAKFLSKDAYRKSPTLEEGDSSLNVVQFQDKSALWVDHSLECGTQVKQQGASR